jgi:hypothetical protein
VSVEPKRKKLEAAQASLEITMGELGEAGAFNSCPVVTRVSLHTHNDRAPCSTDWIAIPPRSP